MISFNNGSVFINGEKVTNPELIGNTIMDFAETLENDGIVIELKDADVFVTNVGKCIEENTK